jgi:hypothetical protein
MRGAGSGPHFVIASPAGRGAPRLSDEVDAIDWIDPSGLPSPTTPELGEILASAPTIESRDA